MGRPTIPVDRRCAAGRVAPAANPSHRSIAKKHAGADPVRPSRRRIDQICQIVAKVARSSRLAAQFGLLRKLFLGITSTFSGSARSISRRAIRSIRVAVVRPSRSASCAAISTLWAKPSRLTGYAIPVPLLGYEMKNPAYVAELHKNPRSSIGRNGRKPATAEGLPENSVRPAFRNHRTGRTFGDYSIARRSLTVLKLIQKCRACPGSCFNWLLYSLADG